MRSLGILALSLVVWALGASSAEDLRWHEARTKSFIVAGDANPQVVRKLAVELEQFREFLGVFVIGLVNEEKRPVRVYLVADDKSFASILGRKTQAVGVYTFRIEEGIFIANATKTYGDSLVTGQRWDEIRSARQTLKHEYLHHFFQNVGPYYYPLWYNEGIAEYFSTFDNRGKKGIMGVPPDGASISLQFTKWMPWRLVFSSIRTWQARDTGFRFQTDTIAQYGQAWLAVHYLRSQVETADALERYLDMIRVRPNQPQEVFEEAFGKTYEELGAEIREYFEGNRFVTRSLDLSDYNRQPTVETRRLNDYESRLAKAEASSFFLWDTKHKESAEEQYRVLIKQQPKDVRPKRTLALMAYRDGQDGEALQLSESIVAVDANDSIALTIQALIGPSEQRVASLRRAIAADPTNVLALHEFARLHLLLGTPTEEALDAAIKAMELSPEPFRVQVTAGELLAELGYADDARYVLEPAQAWATDPAVRRRAERALQLLERIRR